MLRFIDPFVSVSLVSPDTSGGSDVDSVIAQSNGHNAPVGERFDLVVNLPDTGLCIGVALRLPRFYSAKPAMAEHRIHTKGWA
ncbi:MAG: hypothetical protein ACUVSV_15750 [Armatimonadota bacterium]